MITTDRTSFVIRKWNDPVTLRPNVVNPIEKQFRVEEDKNGNAIYTEVKGGDRNVSEYVNSFKDGASLESMLDRISLLPTHEKIAYLNQVSNGLTGDTRVIPKDGTEAFMALKRAKTLLPNFDEYIRAGKSFNEIVSAINERYNPQLKNSAAENKESEENVNG